MNALWRICPLWTLWARCPNALWWCPLTGIHAVTHFGRSLSGILACLPTRERGCLSGADAPQPHFITAGVFKRLQSLKSLLRHTQFVVIALLCHQLFVCSGFGYALIAYEHYLVAVFDSRKTVSDNKARSSF